MRKTVRLQAGIALWLAIGCSFVIVSGAEAQNGRQRRVAGSYLMEVLHDGFPPAQALATLTRDGSFIATDTSDEGAGGLTSRDSPVHGVWKFLGNRQIKARTLYFTYDDDGIPLAYWRTDGTFEFDQGFNSGSGTLVVSKFLLDQDPLDPDEVPVDTLNATLTGRRITLD